MPSEQKIMAKNEGLVMPPPPVVRPSVPPSPAFSPAFSRGSSLDRDVSLGPETSQRVLRVKRLLDGVWTTEIVRDPAVIRAYVRRRQLIEEENTTANLLAPTGDQEKDARAKKRYVMHFALKVFTRIMALMKPP